MLKALRQSLGALLLVGVLLGSGGAQANPDLRQAEARVASAVLAWASAQARHAEALEAQRRLAAEIDAERQRNNRPRLERLLQRSLESERRVAESSREQDEHANMVRLAVDEAFRRAAAEFRTVRPLLSSKDRAERARAQETLAFIQAMRARVKDHQLALTRTHESTPKNWERYDQRPAANDGPEELRAKADFVADHRDKFKKKRAELLKLIEEARQERELARLAANFQQDAFLYDENARTGRVARGNNALLSGVGNETTDRGANNTPTVQTPGEASGPSPGPAAPQDPAAAFDGTGGRSEDGASESPTPTSPPAAPSGPAPSLGGSVPLPREFNPTALLNLEIDRIDASTVSLEQLISTLRNLEKLDELLERRESELVQRARQLEQAEKPGAE